MQVQYIFDLATYKLLFKCIDVRRFSIIDLKYELNEQDRELLRKRFQH